MTDSLAPRRDFQRQFSPLKEKMLSRLQEGQEDWRTFMGRAQNYAYMETEELRFVKIPYLKQGFYMLVAISTDDEDDIDEWYPRSERRPCF